MNTSTQKNDEMKMASDIRKAKSFDELLDIKYGKVGTEKRDDFDERAQYFVISEMLTCFPQRHTRLIFNFESL